MIIYYVDLLYYFSLNNIYLYNMRLKIFNVTLNLLFQGVYYNNYYDTVIYFIAKR